MTEQATKVEISEKGFVPTLLLCFFLGMFWIHRFYVWKIGTGIVMLLTLWGLGIWSMIDFIMIAVGSFTDKEWKTIKSA
jgi:TM2 domain-containing membrane protein YozV